MKNLITLLQIVFSTTLIILILLQARGTGLNSAWGGSGESFRSKRGVEKALFVLTIAFAVLFCLSSYLTLIVH